MNAEVDGNELPILKYLLQRGGSNSEPMVGSAGWNESV